MVFKWLTNETKSFYIARPAEYANDLIYLHPDKSIPRGTKLTVRSDECVLFFREGNFIGRINSGTVLLDTANIPFLGHLLIDKFTDANHFICEIFFISLKESIFEIPLCSLGQYKDTNSSNLVSINARANYTVKVIDPVKLVIGMGGQNQYSGSVVEVILNGRVLNQFRKAVGVRTLQKQVLDVVSNVDSENISDEIKKVSDLEFESIGIKIVRIFDLILSLDQESYQVLRAFGKQEAELSIQAKGMRLAQGEGFAEYNLIQGQRAALEGLGKGFETGNGPVMMTGLNFGGNLTGSSQRPVQRTQAGNSPTRILSSQMTYVIKSDTGESGPYSARQVAIMAISKNIKISDLLIRGSDDPYEVAYTADSEPQILSEYTKRKPSIEKISGNATLGAFEMAFNAAISDDFLTKAEIEMLSSLALTLGEVASLEEGKLKILGLAKSKSIRIED